VAGARHSAPVRTGPGAHPASYKVGTGSLSQGVKRPGRDVDHPPLSSAEVKERVAQNLHSPSGLLLDVMVYTLLHYSFVHVEQEPDV
jgi:hypothetical protein